uniref:PilZ domain-containing protein n=1 Tax=Marinobacterium profundum TaxID=1714300 RepID=UPI000834AA47|nr:PilZ domain-containing protein [Marinobacterium profundum]
MSRHYIRHPSEIPIQIVLGGQPHAHRMSNVSLGGLCIHTHHCLPNNTEIIIRIPLLMPEFSATGRVCWCHYQAQEDALLGICFSDEETAFAVRMVEQVCHIESYRQQTARKKGINYSSEEAAAEWIARYAHHFASAPGSDQS